MQPELQTDADVQRLIAAIHDSGRKMVIATTGGGANAISTLVGIPGASRTILEAVVPYSEAALCGWIRGKPTGSLVNGSCSESTARAMAMASWIRAKELAPQANLESLVGVGCTASLATDRPKRGEHRVHVALQTSRLTKSFSLALTKDARPRSDEERIAAALTLIAVGEACSCDAVVVEGALRAMLLDGEAVVVSEAVSRPEWVEVLIGQRSETFDGNLPGDRPELLFPGAFNPPHRGHLKMAEIAEAHVGKPLTWEISLRNVDKPPLDWISVRERIDALRQADLRRPIVLTTNATFDLKAADWPGAVFVVGVDTIRRVADPRYYGNEAQARDEALADLAAAGARFLVFGRLVDGVFVTLADLDLPAALTTICEGIGAEEFREDVSSTELRDASDLPVRR